MSNPDQNPREFETLLPVGYTDGSGLIHRRATLRKMRGHEEALLYDQSLTAGKLITELIRSCLVRLGDIETITPQLASELCTADRNYLLLELRRITIGDYLPAQYVCPGCDAQISAVLDLGAVPVHRLEEGKMAADVSVQLEDGYRNRKGETHTDIVLRMPRGVDEEFVSSMAGKDPLHAQDVLLLRCIKRFGKLTPEELEGYGIKILRDLTLGDRRLLFNALNKTPGADFQITIHCDSCGTSFKGVIDTTNFFV